MQQFDTAVRIPIKDVAPDTDNIRRVQPTAEEEAAFRASIEAEGQIVPILVRKVGTGRKANAPMFKIVFGNRRLMHTKALGRPDILAIDAGTLTDAQAAALQATENANRADMHPVDKWRAMVRLEQTGMDIIAAGRCLGLTNRQAAQHAQLGKIIPELLDEMITKGPPADHDLRTIACATLENQRAALKKSKNRNGLNWWEIANLLRIRSYTRNVALFDIDKTPTVTWQRDAFAEPGAADEWTTTDVDAFMKAQRAAIEAKVAAEKKRRLPVEVAEFDAHGPKIPAGWKQSSDKPRGKTVPEGDGRKRLVALDARNGLIAEIWIEPISKAAKKEAGVTDGPARKTGAVHRGNEDAEAPGDDAIGEGTGADGDAEGDGEAAETSNPVVITNKGLELIAARKTEAIRAQLYQEGPQLDVRLLLSLLVLAVCGRNVEVNPSSTSRYAKTKLTDIATKLIDADGRIDRSADIASIAADLIGRLVVITNPVTDLGSGPLADLIGYEISAENTLPAFDDAEFLGTLRLPLLEEAKAKIEGLKVKGAGKIRKALEGKLGTRWRPPQAEFKSVGPEGITTPLEQYMAEIERERADDDEEGGEGADDENKEVAA